MALTSDDLRWLHEKIGRLGLLGGTFDPVHNGHLTAAEAVRKDFGLDAVLFIPAARPPHKTTYRISSFQDRMAMLELATAGRPDLLVTDIEAERQGPSYSVDTLRHFHQLWGGRIKLFFILGLDAFADIATWKEYHSLPRLAELVVLNRFCRRVEEIGHTIHRLFPEFEPAGQEITWNDPRHGSLIHFFALNPVEVSSTRVRAEAGSGGNLESLVPARVADYIRGHRLYKDQAGLGRNKD
jgi:nicotinate-nucleotide adenylyltransferase